MTHPRSKSEVADVVLSGSSIIAKLLGVVDPSAATIGVIADCIKERRSRKFATLLENLIHSLEKRVQHLESELQEGVNLDLLDEIIAKAISDEDEDKTEFYAALIEYYATHPLEPYEIRFLGNALKGLTIYEIESFIKFSKGQNIKEDLPESLEEVFWIRINYLGLHKGGTVRHPNQISLVGRKLIEIYDLATSAG